MKTCNFLRAYQLHSQPVRVRRDEEGGSDSVNVTSEQGRTETVRGSEGGVRLSEEGSAAGRQDTSGSKDGETESQQESVGGGEEGGCELVRRRAVLGGWEGVTGAGYFDEQWRTRLCRCASCKVGGWCFGGYYQVSYFPSYTNTHTHIHTHTHTRSSMPPLIFQEALYHPNCR